MLVYGLQFVQRGNGKPVVLIHGLGGSSRSWEPILGRLGTQRAVTAVDLPGFGATPPLVGTLSIQTMADAVTDFLRARNLVGADVVGSSMGAWLVLELARRGVVGSVVSLDPGGFWRGAETTIFELSVGASIRLVNLIGPILPLLVPLAHGAAQLGATVESDRRPLTIGWGRHDRVCLPRGSKIAAIFPMWDSPEEAVQLILDRTG